MKITRVEIKHFRAFPGPCVYTFDLPGGKNLLLYGENGSGKSSLFHALDQFFNLDSQAAPFSDMVHLFSKDDSGNDITDGFVTVYFDDDPPSSLTWPQGGDRPTSDPRIVDTALRKGYLEYRSLLRTNFVEGNLDERLFKLAVEVLLARIPVPLGGTPRTVGEYWNDVRKPSSHHRRVLEHAETAINLFNQAFKAILPDVEKKASELLDYFTGHHLKLHLEFDDLIYDKPSCQIQNQKLGLKIEFNGRPVSGHEALLNEARLSALALALYLASILLSDPAPRPGVATPLKLLVMDDVLIGLDLSNRLPLLEILTNHFGDYQVILSTYDRVWFDLAHLQTLDTGKWVYAELFFDRIGDPGYDVPVLKANRDFLQQAKAHYQAHDYRAATVYARVAFENKLKNFCSRKRLPVPYDRDPRRMSSEDFWNAVTSIRGGDGKCHVDGPTKARIESLRKVVLNPLSHADANSITKTEVDAAIKTVEGLSLT
jgi:energy-coupling factor transporter ATP-binding protein EcfA2